MNRNFYLEIAKSGAAFPIGTDLVVHEFENPAKVMNDGELLGKAVEKAAIKYNSPLAFPLMDLKLEKALLLDILGIPGEQIDGYHFETNPGKEAIEKVLQGLSKHSNQRIEATCGAIKYIAEKTTLFPVGMCIGPFSLMTKLMSDPITAIYLIGMGVKEDEDDSVALAKTCLELSTIVIKHYVLMQIRAGAKAIIMCEPAANKIYISPVQMEEGSDVFDSCVTKYIKEIKTVMTDNQTDLILHDCGELTDKMVEKLASLDPVILSLGSSRKLWEDAKLVPKNIVLYGNLPSKYFYSDEKISKAQVIEMAKELIQKMKETGHPFILGSECDVLSVPEAVKTIHEKVDAFVACSCCKH